MPQPALDGSDRDTGLVMHGGKAFPEPVQDPPLADRMSRTRLTRLVRAFTTVEPCAESQRLKRSEEMAVFFTAWGSEDETGIWVPLSSCLEQGH